MDREFRSKVSRSTEAWIVRGDGIVLVKRSGYPAGRLWCQWMVVGDEGMDAQRVGIETIEITEIVKVALVSSRRNKTVSVGFVQECLEGIQPFVPRSGCQRRR